MDLNFEDFFKKNKFKKTRMQCNGFSFFKIKKNVRYTLPVKRFDNDSLL